MLLLIILFLKEYLKNKLNILYIQVWKKDGKKLYTTKEEKNLRKKF